MDEEKDESSVFKIACGVFLGVIAALIAYSIPGWMRKHEAEKHEERETIRETNFLEIQPKQLIAHCGPAIKDRVTTLYGSTSRDMTIKETSGDTIDAEFTDLANNPKHRDWSLTNIDGFSASAAYAQGIIPICVSKEIGEEVSYSSPYEFTPPEDFISRCGKPLNEGSWRDGSSSYCEVMFPGKSGHVTLEFRDILSNPKNPDWSLESVNNLPIRDTFSTQEIQKLGPCIEAGP